MILCVASQRVFIVVYFIMTQSGNFWIYPRIFIRLSQQISNAIFPVLFISRRNTDKEQALLLMQNN
jgi:hypothetical protein